MSGDEANSLLSYARFSWCCWGRRFQRKKKPSAQIRPRPPTDAATPIPAFAPVLSEVEGADVGKVDGRALDTKEERTLVEDAEDTEDAEDAEDAEDGVMLLVEI